MMMSHLKLSVGSSIEWLCSIARVWKRFWSKDGSSDRIPILIQWEKATRTPRNVL